LPSKTTVCVHAAPLVVTILLLYIDTDRSCRYIILLLLFIRELPLLFINPFCMISYIYIYTKPSTINQSAYKNVTLIISGEAQDIAGSTRIGSDFCAAFILVRYNHFFFSPAHPKPTAALPDGSCSALLLRQWRRRRVFYCFSFCTTILWWVTAGEREIRKTSSNNMILSYCEGVIQNESSDDCLSSLLGSPADFTPYDYTI